MCVRLLTLFKYWTVEINNLSSITKKNEYINKNISILYYAFNTQYMGEVSCDSSSQKEVRYVYDICIYYMI